MVAIGCGLLCLHFIIRLNKFSRFELATLQEEKPAGSGYKLAGSTIRSALTTLLQVKLTSYIIMNKLLVS